MKKRMLLLAVLVAAATAACTPGIHGSVQLLDAAMNPVPLTKESPEGTVVNLINITAVIEKASHAVTVNAKGEFESEKDRIAPGIYKVEASRIGYETKTETVEVSSYGATKVDLKLRKIKESKRKTFEGSRSDEDKIINPGEVNIQPPTM